MVKKSVTVKRVRARMTFFYTVLILLAVSAVFTYTFIALKKVGDEEFSEHMVSINTQFVSSINYFTNHCESDCTDIFRNDTLMDYNPVENDYEEYENTQLKNDVKTTLLEMSAGKNYNDFFIVYSNSDSSGKISQGASELISRSGYEFFEQKLDGNSDAWLFNLHGSNRKVYYLRKINDSSIFVLSCYTDVVESVLSVGKSSADDTYILADKNGYLILSNNSDLNCGEAVPDEYISLFDYPDGDCVVSSDFIGASLLTDCGWRIISCTESPILIEKSTLTWGTIFIVLTALIFISIITGNLACTRFASSDLNNPDNEFIDPLTGVLNEYGLDERISETVETSIIGSTYAFIVLSVKDSKQIRSTLQPKYWNSVRKKLISAAEEFFANRKYSIGRVYEDQIVIFVDYSEFDLFKAHENVKKGCEEFCQSFKNFAIGADGELKLNISIGACIYPDHAENFDELLEAAESALKQADSKDGDSFVLFKPVKKESEAKR